METYYDNYVVGYDEETDEPIYDTLLSHTALVARARKATGKNHLVSIDWYDTWEDWDTLDRNGNPKERFRAKVVMR